MKATSLPTFAALAALAFTAPAFAAEADTPTASKTNAAPATPGPEEGLRLNFRGVSLETVLNYMSEAAGYIINVAPGTDVKGKVEVWSNQAMSKEEAVQLLNTVLNQNNLTAVRTGRTLTIMNRTDGKTNSRTPVKKGNKPEDIEPTEEMVTQIIAVQFANAAQLVQNLQPLLPEYAQTGLSANEAGNALILTANKTDVRRMVEIVSALDTAIGSVSSIRVFPLKYADAKELVTAVKELFTPPAAQNQNNRGGGAAPPFLQQMFGGGGGGGGGPFGGGGGPFGGGGGGGGRGAGGAGAFGRTGGGATGNTSQTAARVVAVADERSNSLIVAAADESIPTIEKLVKEIDVPVDDVTELRVYPLVNSDPNDIVTILSELFPDETTTGSGQGPQIQFGGRGGFGGFGGGGSNRGAQTAGSERMKKQGKVVAVAEARTSSVIVSAARDLMPQIEAMIKQIDSVRAKQKRVHVIPIKNADVTDVEAVVREMFDRSGNGRNNTAQQNNALTSRAQQNIQQQGQNTGGFGGQGGGNQGARFGQ